MTEGVLEASSGGGSTPIRGKILLDDNTKDDFTVGDERYLRAGNVETNVDKFDIDLWDEAGAVRIASQNVVNRFSGPSYKSTSVMIDYHAGTNVIFASALNSNTAGYTIKHSYSLDKGVTWNYTEAGPNAHASGSCKPNYSSGRWCFGVHGSPNVTSTNDLGLTWNSVDAGTGGNIFGVLGDETAIVAWSNAGNARRSTDGGLTWKNVPTLVGSNTYFQALVLRADLWVLFTYDDVRVSTDQGLTWTSHSNTTPHQTHQGHKVFTDGVDLLQYGLNSHPVIMWKSNDGINWTDTGLRTTDGSVYAGHTIAIASNIHWNGEMWGHDGQFSKDLLAWENQVDLGSYSASVNVDNTFASISSNFSTIYKLLNFAGTREESTKEAFTRIS